MADSGPVHVHGLGINPNGGALFIATHTGTWRVGPEARRPQRVSQNHQDTMGFTVVGPDHFLGSGHPDVRDAQERGLPPLLGLIESRDAGKTWRPISLLGEADFHVLRVGGERVYGYDASNDRLLASADNGRTWRQLDHPAPVVDLAIRPSESRHVLASTEAGLFESVDGGEGWKQVGPEVGLLAWPRFDALYLVDGSGVVYVSRNFGRRWTARGNIGGQPAAFLGHGEQLYVALHDGTVKRSTSGARSWTLRSHP